MLIEEETGVVATKATADQKSAEVSSQKSSAPKDASNVKEDAKIQKESKESDSSAKIDEEKDKTNNDKETDKQEPFHKNPAFQRLVRNNKAQSAKIEVLEKTNQEAISLLKEMIATTKGEEYKPEEKKIEVPSAQELLDMEMDRLLEEQELSPEDETGTIEIAKKYTHELGDGTKVYLPAKVALQIYKDLQTGKKETPKASEEKKEEEPKKRSPDTRPSAGAKNEAEISKVDSLKTKPKNLYEAIARAKRLVEGG